MEEKCLKTNLANLKEPVTNHKKRQKVCLVVMVLSKSNTATVLLCIFFKTKKIKGEIKKLSRLYKLDVMHSLLKSYYAMFSFKVCLILFLRSS